MNKMDRDIEQFDSVINVLLQNLRIQSKVNEVLLHSNYLIEIRNAFLEQENYSGWIFRLIWIYNTLSWFPSKKNIDGLKYFGLNDDQLIWFIKVTDIQKAIARINKRGLISITNPKAFKLILDYIHAQIIATVLRGNKENFYRHGGRYKHTIEIIYESYCKKKIYAKKVKKKKPEDEFIRLMDLVNINERGMKEIILNSAKPNQEKNFFIPFYESCVNKLRPELPESEIMVELYPLFRIILKNHNLPSAKEYDSTVHGYDTFNRFVVTHMKRIFKKRSK